MFKEERDKLLIGWKDLGDIEEGRPSMGHMLPVSVYRLFQYTLKDVLIKETSVARANQIISRTGYASGDLFFQNLIGKDLDFEAFIVKLQERLSEYKIGIMRMERMDNESGEILLTVAEDLDCSGLPFSDETVCNYDEGFLSAIFSRQTGRKYKFTEIDCWASGDRVCRFRGIVEK